MPTTQRNERKWCGWFVGICRRIMFSSDNNGERLIGVVAEGWFIYLAFVTMNSLAGNFSWEIVQFFCWTKKLFTIKSAILSWFWFCLHNVMVPKSYHSGRSQRSDVRNIHHDPIRFPFLFIISLIFQSTHYSLSGKKATFFQKSTNLLEFL